MWRRPGDKALQVPCFSRTECYALGSIIKHRLDWHEFSRPLYGDWVFLGFREISASDR